MATNMRVDITVQNNEDITRLQDQASSHPDIDVRIYLAPPSLEYSLPFPIVALVMEGRVHRQFGDDGERFFQEILSGESEAVLYP